MFASIRKYKKYNVGRGSAEELAKRMREGFVPMMRQIRGQGPIICLWRPGPADHDQDI